MNAEVPETSLLATEDERLRDLRSFDVVDTPREEPFDGIVEVAAALFETPFALLTLLETDRQWFKASMGTDLESNERKGSFCNTTIMNTKTLIVPDASLDPRFASLPFVADGPRLRFYAGTPLISDRGYAIGTLCILDVRPREIPVSRVRLLERLARHAVDALESRRLMRQLLDGFIEQERYRRVGE